MPYTFNENCIDCEKCAERCAAGAVIVLRDGGRIRCEVDQDLCVSCGHCGYICEKSSVIDDKGVTARYVPVSKWKSPSIDLDKCTGCMLCVEVCPEYALAISKPRAPGDINTFAFLAETEKCMGCGMCAGRCPVGAIDMV